MHLAIASYVYHAVYSYECASDCAEHEGVTEIGRQKTGQGTPGNDHYSY